MYKVEEGYSMNSIANSSVVEDRYIAHLAEMQGGQKTIEFIDKLHAWGAQKHPVLNIITSGITGSVKATAITTLFVLAFPLGNTRMLSNICGSAMDLCVPCGIHTRSITQSITDLSVFINKFNPYVSYWEEKVLSYAFGVCGKVMSEVLGIGATGTCFVNDKTLIWCRGVNYIGSVLETLSENRILLAAIAISLTAVFTNTAMNSWTAAEHREEEDLKNVLTERFGKIATRLSALEINKEVQECAHKILQRQLEINEEVKSLNLPSLKQKDIEQITKPVFDAAKEVQLKSKSETT